MKTLMNELQMYQSLGPVHPSDPIVEWGFAMIMAQNDLYCLVQLHVKRQSNDTLNGRKGFYP